MKKKRSPFDEAIAKIERSKRGCHPYNKSPLWLVNGSGFSFFQKYLEVDNLLNHTSTLKYYEVLYLRLLLAREIWIDRKTFK